MKHNLTIQYLASRGYLFIWLDAVLRSVEHGSHPTAYLGEHLEGGIGVDHGGFIDKTVDYDTCSDLFSDWRQLDHNVHNFHRGIQ